LTYEKYTKYFYFFKAFFICLLESEIFLTTMQKIFTSFFIFTDIFTFLVKCFTFFNHQRKNKNSYSPVK